MLERLQIGPDDAFTFIHLSLGEYVTGCYISRLDDHEIRELVTRFRRDPRWREPLLLSAGAGATTAIVEQLLQLDDVLNPVATESLLAAAALAEETLPKADLAQLVAEHIATRLASPIPLIAHECVDNALGLAAQASNLMAQMLKPLLRHPQAWTRLAAMRLALATEDEALDLDALEACIDEGSPPQFEPVLGGLRGLMISKPKMMWNDVIAYGVKRLASERPTLATIECTTRLPA